jgi:thiol:disulfide interchange protein DsbD
MRRLLCLLFLVLALPATAAGLLESRPSSTLGSINNSADFLPVREAFQLSLVESTPQSIKLRFVATEGYYLYRHRFQFRADPADVTLGPAQLPDGQKKHDEYFGDVEVYHGILDVELPRTDQRAFTWP